MLSMASILDNHLSAILDDRRAGRAWAEIARRLAVVGVVTTPQNVSDFIRRRRNKAVKLSRELRPFDRLAATSQSAERHTDSKILVPPAADIAQDETAALDISKLPRNDPRRWVGLEQLKQGLPPG